MVRPGVSVLGGWGAGDLVLALAGFVCKQRGPGQLTMKNQNNFHSPRMEGSQKAQRTRVCLEDK